MLLINRGEKMEKKIDLPKLWRLWTLGFFALSWIIIVFIFKQSELLLIPVFIIYLLINALIFNSYFLGMVGNFYFITGKREQAFKYFRKAISKNTRNVNTLYYYSIEILKEGKGKEALELLNKALKLNTKIIMDKNIILAIGSCYWTTGEIDKAIETLESLKKKYEYINAHVMTTLGYFYFLKKNYSKALEYSENAIKDSSEHAPAWDNMGQIYYAQNDFEKAKEYFKKALELNESMVDSLYYMGMIYESQNNTEKAKEYFEKAHLCNVTSLNTVTKEQIEEKYSKYK